MSIIRPDGAGINSHWTPDTGTNYARVNESSSDSDTSYVATSVQYYGDFYTFDNVTLTGGQSITSVTITATVRKTTTGTSQKLWLMCYDPSNTTYYYYGDAFHLDSNLTDDTSYHTYSKTFSVDPRTSAAWTETNVNQEQFGFQKADAEAGTIRVTQIYVTVAIKNTSSVAGTMGALTGSLVRRTNKSVSGATGSLLGSVTRRTGKALAGAISTLTGVVSRKSFKYYSGASGALTGALLKRTNKSLTGISGSLSGTLAPAGRFVRVLSGTIGGLTGELARKALKSLTGTSGSLSGSLNRLTYKALSGASGALTGTLSQIRLYVISLSGTITGTGSLVRVTYKNMNGAVGALTGTLSAGRTLLVVLAGFIGFGYSGYGYQEYGTGTYGGSDLEGGNLSRITFKPLTGITGSLTGNLISAKLILVLLNGSIDVITGTVSRLTKLTKTGSITVSGLIAISFVFKRAKMKAGSVLATTMSAGSVVAKTQRAASILYNRIGGGNRRT